MDEIKTTIKALEKSRIKTYHAKDRARAKEIVMSMINKDDIIGFGGSMTLEECGIMDELRSGGYNLLDWGKESISDKEKRKILEKTMTCDVFLSSSNAVTMDGKLYNVDGKGNRVSALAFGPKKRQSLPGRRPR